MVLPPKDLRRIMRYKGFVGLLVLGVVLGGLFPSVLCGRDTVLTVTCGNQASTKEWDFDFKQVVISDNYFSRLTTIKIPVFQIVKNRLQSEFSTSGDSIGNRSSSKEINDAFQTKSDAVG